MKRELKNRLVCCVVVIVWVISATMMANATMTPADKAILAVQQFRPQGKASIGDSIMVALQPYRDQGKTRWSARNEKGDVYHVIAILTAPDTSGKMLGRIYEFHVNLKTKKVTAAFDSDREHYKATVDLLGQGTIAKTPQ